MKKRILPMQPDPDLLLDGSQNTLNNIPTLLFFT